MLAIIMFCNMCMFIHIKSASVGRTSLKNKELAKSLLCKSMYRESAKPLIAS